MATLQLDEDGARLYRRTNSETVTPGQNKVFPGTVAYDVVRLCGWYPSPLLRAAKGSVVNGRYEFEGLDYTQLRPTGPTAARDAYFAGINTPPGSDLGYICADFQIPRNALPREGADPLIEVVKTPGWNTGAVSRSAFYRNGRIRFRVLPGAKMLVGLQGGSDPTVPTSRFFGFNFMPFATAGLVSGIVRGQGDEGSVETATSSHSDFAPYSETTIFEVELLNDVLKFKRGGVAFGSSTLLTGAFAQPGVWALGAAIWEPGAWVEGIEVTQYDGAVLSTPAMKGKAGQGSVLKGGVLVTALPVVRGRMATKANAVTPKLALRASNYTIGDAALVTPGVITGGMEMSATAVPYALLRMPRLRGSGRSLVGSVGRGALVASSVYARGSEGARGEAAHTLPAMTLTAAAGDPYAAQFFSHGNNRGSLTAFSEIVVLMNTAGAMATSVAAVMLKSADLKSVATAATSATLSSVIAELMQTTALVGADVPLYEKPNEVWVVNLANNATTTFEDYPFNSFGTIGGRTFGVKADGLFLLDGSTDDGQPIKASVSYGQQDFNSKAMKNMTRAYVGASSSGKLLLRITANGTTYTYEARDWSNETAQQRFDVGRGLKANYFTFELANQGGADFEVDSVSFFAAEFIRRI